MTLPSSQYSVLDGNKVERLGDDTFCVCVSALRFFSFEVQPVLTLQVQGTPRGCIISMLACKLQGNRIVEAQNSQFSARMTNQGAGLCWEVCSGANCARIGKCICLRCCPCTQKSGVWRARCA
jgi:hypothetical protein